MRHEISLGHDHLLLEIVPIFMQINIQELYTKVLEL